MSLLYIIDGYNIINHPLFSRTHKKIKNTQIALLEFIKTGKLTGSLKNKITVIFDGYPTSDGCDYGGNDIEVIFSRKISADDKIKRIVEESANRKNVVVVSDDREISFIVKSLGARCLGIEEFVGKDEKSRGCQKNDLLKPELSYTQIHKINQELSKIWLK
jgi:predicted RNA-binding protein with PIN domain